VNNANINKEKEEKGESPGGNEKLQLYSMKWKILMYKRNKTQI